MGLMVDHRPEAKQPAKRLSSWQPPTRLHELIKSRPLWPSATDSYTTNYASRVPLDSQLAICQAARASGISRSHNPLGGA
jgi:hypothetical protein